MIVDRWNDRTNLDERLADIKRRFEDDCPDADRVVRFELRMPPAFGRWLNDHPVIAYLREEHMKQEIRRGKIHLCPRLMLCDNVRAVAWSTIIGDCASLIATLDTGREIKVATIGCP